MVQSNPRLYWAYLGLYLVFYTLPLFVGLTTREIFDGLAGDGRFDIGVWTLLAILAGIEITRLIVIFSLAFLSGTFHYKAEALLRHNMLSWLLWGKNSSKRLSPGDAVSRFRDDTGVLNDFIGTWVDLAGELLASVGAIVIMLMIDPKITAVVVVPLVAIVLVTERLTGRIQRLRARSRETGAKVLTFVAEMFGAVQAIRVGSAERFFLAHLANLNEARREAWIRDRMLAAFVAAFSSNMTIIGVGVVLLLAAGAMQRGSFTVGDFALFASYLELSTAGPRWIGRLLAKRRQTEVSIGRMETLMQGAGDEALTRGPELRAESRHEESPFVELLVNGLTYRYGDSGRGIQDTNFTVRNGELVVITGKVGAGKTTLLRAMLGLINVDSGELCWNGEAITEAARFMRPPRCAYVGQLPVLFSESLQDNIVMGWQATPAQVEGAVEAAMLSADIAQLDEGLDTVVGARGVKLSGGQLQRAATARALVRGADLLVLDDVSNALDTETETTLWNRLSHRRCAILAVAHRRAAFRKADRILVLDNGKLVSRGEWRELLEISAVFREIWEAAG